jgi:uncharacterized tellurite resistance protein B-like protein
MLEELVNFLAYGSLMLGAVSAYLSLNKLWSRKHLPDVAESISIPGAVLEVVPTFIFGVYYFMNTEMVGVIDSVIWTIVAGTYILIGSGFWVRGRRGVGFWRLAWQSIKTERGELANLAMSIVHPDSSGPLIELLRRLAEVDGEISEQEARLVSDVAAQMNIELKIEPHKVADSRVKRLLNIRNALEQFLVTSPPQQNVEKLEYLMHQLNVADGHEHEDEKSAFEEVQGMIRSYLENDPQPALFRVLIALQSESQLQRINDLLRGPLLHDGAGGRGVTVGEFYTREYAGAVCEEYRDLGFFCVVTDEVMGK